MLAAEGAAMGAHWTFGPEKFFEFIESGGFIVKVGGGQADIGLAPMSKPYLR